MALSPRSLAHAIRGEFGPRLRMSPVEGGQRAMVFDRGAVEARPPTLIDPAGLREQPTTTPRFIDNFEEVGFRQGLSRAAREGFDFFVDSGGPDRISSLGPVERVRVPGRNGFEDRDALRITPEVRSRIASGRTGFRYGEAEPPEPRPFVPQQHADGGGMEFRTNADGWRLLLPYGDKWGDPRFDEADRGAAFARLQEIESTDWRTATWDDAVRAYDDIEEILAQHFFYRPDVTLERAAEFDADPENQRIRFFGGEVREYVQDRFGERARARGQRPSVIAADPDRSPDLAEVGDRARRALNALERRAGIMNLLAWGERAPRAERDKPVPGKRQPNRAGFVSAVRRAVEQLPDSVFARPADQLFNTIAKARNVTREELDFMQLRERMMQQGRWTREDLLRAIDKHRLEMVRANTEFDPRRPTRQYNNGGTRAFDGPRVPGPGRYFEETFAFPMRTRGGRKIPAAEVDDSHWTRGVWGSIRGSVREDPKYGRGVLGEELQRDFYQHIASGRTSKLPEREFAQVTAVQRAEERTRFDASSQAHTIWSRYIDSGAALDPAVRDIDLQVMRSAAENGDLTMAARAVDAIRAELDRKIARGTQEIVLGKVRGLLSDAEGALFRAQSIIKDKPDAFTPEAAARAGVSYVPEPPMSDSASTRFLVRALFTRAAREDAEWIAIPTGATNNRIQANTFASAAHYYDGALRNVLERVARDVSGGQLKVERVTLATPPLKRGVTVHMVRGLTPEIRARIREGLPSFGEAQRFPRRANAIPTIEEAVRTSWGRVGQDLLESEAITVVDHPRDLRFMFDDETIDQIPDWVGAVHDESTGRTFLFAERLEPSRVRQLVLHEVGVHHGMPTMLGAKRYAAVQRSAIRRLDKAVANVARVTGVKREAGQTPLEYLGSMLRAVREDPEVAARLDGIDPADTFWLSIAQKVENRYAPTDPRYADELLAYTAEAAEQALMTLPEAHPDRTWWEQILDAIRRWAVTTFGLGELSARDVHTLAIAGLKHVADDASTGPLGAVPGDRVVRHAQARGFDGDDPLAAARWLDEQGYFSAAIEAARRYPDAKGQRSDMVNWLRNRPGVKKDELNTMFLDEFVAAGKTATREQFVEWLQAHRYALRVETRPGQGPLAEGTKPATWGDYTYFEARRPGASGKAVPAGYFEQIVRPTDPSMPGEAWRGGHMAGGLGHMRGADGVQVAGKIARVLVELQSDYMDAKSDEFWSGIARGVRRRQEDFAVFRTRMEATRAPLLAAIQEFDPRARVGDDGQIVFGDGGDQEIHVSYGRALADAQQGLESEPHAALRTAYNRVLEFNKEWRNLAERQRDDSAGVLAFNDREPGIYGQTMSVREVNPRQTRDADAPFQSTWPDMLMRQAVLEAIKNGDERLAWSTADAIRRIPGMSGYKGDMYDKRLPRFIKRWLGVEPQRAPLESGVSTKEDLGDPDAAFEVGLQIYQEAGPEASSAMRDRYEYPQGFDPGDPYGVTWEGELGRRDRGLTPAQAYVQRVIDEEAWMNIYMELGDVDMFAQLARWGGVEPSIDIKDARIAFVRQGREALFKVFNEAPLEWKTEAGLGPELTPEQSVEVGKYLQAAQVYFGHLFDVTYQGFHQFRVQNDAIKAPPEVWYIDLTPEVRRRAEAGRSMFFGEASRIRFGESDGVESGYRQGDGEQPDAQLAREKLLRVATALEDFSREMRAGRVTEERAAEWLRENGTSVFGETALQRLSRSADEPVPDYRRRGITTADANTAIGSIAAGSAGLAAAGTIVAVASNEKDRAARRAEYERLQAERAESERRQAINDALRAEREELARAIEARDWRSLPEPEGMDTLEGRVAYAERVTDWAEQMTGVPAEFLMELIGRETAHTFRPDIRPIVNGRAVTPVVGWGQFMPDTWAGELMRNGAEYGVNVEGMSRKEIARSAPLQALREDPRFSGIMVAVHARENILELRRRIGRDPTRGEAYAAHFLGVDGAVGFIADVEADRNADYMKRRYRAQADDNPGVFRPGGEWRTARQVMADFTSEFGNERIHIEEESADEGRAAPAGGADQ